MDWKSARSRITAGHVNAAANWVQSHCSNGFEDLYRKTGCAPPRHRYVIANKCKFPAKAFGYLTLMEAGWDQKEGYRPTVNEVVSPLRKFGVMG